MLLKFTGVKTQYAVGMRWAVDDRSGIEAIQSNTDLHYGIMLNINEKISRKLKLVALADASHNKAICLAGLLASQYKNLILVHRVSNVVYWVCIIKNNAVWSGVSVPKATAGDYIAHLSAINEVIDVAKAEFTAEGINLQGLFFSTETANEDFPDFQAVDFFQFVSKLKKSRLYAVRYLQPSKILFRKILLLIVIIIASFIAIYYIQQQRLLTRLLHQQQIEQERLRQQAIQEKENYFSKLQIALRHQAGYAVISNVLVLLRQVPLQSHGWNLAKAIYDVNQPKSLTLMLIRTDFGTLDSFLYAYSASPTNGWIESTNNAGTKTVHIDKVTLEQGPTQDIPRTMLTQEIPREQYRLISYMQLNTELFTFQLREKNKSQYGVNYASFELKGDKLWQLMQFGRASTIFSTLIIKKISFVVDDYDMSWTIEGEIYA